MACPRCTSSWQFWRPIFGWIRGRGAKEPAIGGNILDYLHIIYIKIYISISRYNFIILQESMLMSWHFSWKWFIISWELKHSLSCFLEPLHEMPIIDWFSRHPPTHPTNHLVFASTSWNRGFYKGPPRFHLLRHFRDFFALWEDKSTIFFHQVFMMLSLNSLHDESLQNPFRSANSWVCIPGVGLKEHSEGGWHTRPGVVEVIMWGWRKRLWSGTMGFEKV